MPFRPFRGWQPEVDPSAYVADGAQVIGQVVLGPEASVWFNAVLRGDTDRITVGAGSNIQDGAILHADEGFPCVVGERVVVGHAAILHGCEVGDDCLVGMGAIVLNGAKLDAGSIVAAGALVPEGKQFPQRSLVMGVPAKVVRQVRDDELDNTRAGAEHYRQRAVMYRAEEG